MNENQTQPTIPHAGCMTPGECRTEQVCLDAWCCSAEQERRERAMQKTQSTLPLRTDQLDSHIEQAIWERGSMRHNYQIEMIDGEPEGSMLPRAAASIWRCVREAIEEAGWRIIPR